VAKYRGSADGGVYGFVPRPLSMETYGRLRKPAMRQLGRLGDLSADGGHVSKAGFVSYWL
jgi:hypothetical protein